MNIKKGKIFLKDVTLNMIGFAIYCVAQQIILMPIISKLVDDNTFSNIVIYISILNIICNSTGGEVGNVRLVEDSKYNKASIMGDFTRILVYLIPVISVIGIIIFKILNYSTLQIVILILTINMANIRLYAAAYFRLKQKFNWIIIQNLLYLVGVIVGVVLMYITGNVYIALVLPELFCIIYSIKKSDLLKMKLEKTIRWKSTIKIFIQFGIVSLLTNCMAYYDRLLIYPILGATSVAIYYSITTISKMIAIVINPVSNVLLSWIARAKEENNSKILKRVLVANIPIIILVTIGSIPLTYIAMRILYIQYLEQAINLIIPVSIATAFATGATLTKAVLLKYANAQHLIYVYIVHFALFAGIAYYLSSNNGVMGFTIASIIAKVELWVSFIILLIKKLKGEKNGSRTKENN